MLPKLCHLDNDLVIIIIIQYSQYIYCVVHMTFDLHTVLEYLTWGHFFSHGTPVRPWPVIYAISGQVASAA